MQILLKRHWAKRAGLVGLFSAEIGDVMFWLRARASGAGAAPGVGDRRFDWD